MRVKKRTFFVSVLAAGSLLLVGCASTPAATSTPKASSADANICSNLENTAVWYTALPPAQTQQVLTAFSKDYPAVTVKPLALSGAAASLRVTAEAQAGATAADVVTHSQAGYADEALAKGYLRDISKLPAVAAYPDKFKSNAEFVSDVAPIKVIINTGTVTKTPTKWEDLLKPEFKGKIILVDPRTILSWLGLFNVLYQDKDLGPAFLKKLAAQNPTLINSGVPGAQQVAAGEGSLMVPGMDSLAKPLIDQGAPIKTVSLSPSSGVDITTLVTAKAPHPRAAACFANWLATKPGQLAANTNGFGASPLGALKGALTLPEGYQRPDNAAATANRAAILGALGLG